MRGKGVLVVLLLVLSCYAELTASQDNSSQQLATNGTCLADAPCTCTNGKAGKTRCGDTAADITCNCGRGFHWSKTDTIITICVCLAFGMLAKTVCLVVYLRHRYLKKGRKSAQLMLSDPNKSSPSGSGPFIGSNLEKGGAGYQPMAGTPSQTSSESFGNQEAKPLHIAIDLENKKWQRGTIGDTLKRNAQLAAYSDSSSEQCENPQLRTPSDTTQTPRGFNLEGLSGHVPLLFTFTALQNATQNFSPTLLVGEGGFGRVYYGVLDNREVAIKRLEKVTALPGKHGEKQFRVEVDMMSRLKHPNLLEFIGYCADKGERALVYPLMVNQSLFRRLHERPAQTAPLGCFRRVTIAHQAARALAYLHDDVSPQVIHRDFNSSNVLLNESLDAVVSDFGLAKLVSDESGQTQTTKLFGTMGYMAPEYLHGHVTDKNDVYSFGVVLLELISGRRAVIAKDLDIVQWARRFIQSSAAPLDALADPLIQGTWPEGSLQWVVELAMACVDFDSSQRPRMADVASALEIVLREMRKRQPAAADVGAADQLTSPNPPVTSANGSSPQTVSAEFSMTEFLGCLKKA
ncbi:Protein kinase superfamily protein [Klebsormidium nitens]|uniref:Protein kinase superfamily protein n=1 Tax=Klebsormidium nitens TaxID=105231 RepID=A0A1Y1II90_KLENI|nr:Protein kinase superfamily protein [Klebsormidium nitens]|eukprot:GAQ89219.1 Protein kinase superfamily protein [Klebsormidium nitens]